MGAAEDGAFTEVVAAAEDEGTGTADEEGRIGASDDEVIEAAEDEGTGAADDEGAGAPPPAPPA